MISVFKVQTKTHSSLSGVRQHPGILLTVLFCLLFSCVHRFGFLATRAWMMYFFLQLACIFLALACSTFVWLKHSELTTEIHVIGCGMLCSLVFDLFSFYSWPVNQGPWDGAVELSVTYWMFARLSVAVALLLIGKGNSLPRTKRSTGLIVSLSTALVIASLLELCSACLQGLDNQAFGLMSWKQMWHIMHIAVFLLAMSRLREKHQEAKGGKFGELLLASGFSIGVEFCRMMHMIPFWAILGGTFKVTAYYYLCSFVFAEAFVFPHKKVKGESNKFKRERDMLSALLNSITDEIWFCDLSGNITMANQAAFENLGLLQGEGVGSTKTASASDQILIPLKDLNDKEKQQTFLRTLNGEKVQFTTEDKSPEAPRYRHVVAAPVKSDQGEVYGAVCVVRDVTFQKKTEEALRLSQERSLRIFRANPGLVSIIRLKDGKYIDVNPSWEKHTGYQREEVIGLTEKELNIFLENKEMSSGESITTKNRQVQYTTKSGRMRTGLMSSEIVEIDGEECVFHYINDTTDRESSEKEVSRLERLDTVGQMAVAIGHEIRNPMTTVRGYLQLMREREDQANNNDCLDLMIGELDRANAIISEFLFLASDKLSQRCPRDLNALIESLYPRLSADAFLEYKMIFLDLGEIPCLDLDSREVDQLILNLVKNALEATPRGGRVSIRTYTEGCSVVLAVSDQGSGIAPEVREKIGIPFTSTKDNGTGLGLAVCYSVAQRHDAKIFFETGTEGTTFYVRFSAGDITEEILCPPKAKPWENANISHPFASGEGDSFKADQ